MPTPFPTQTPSPAEVVEKATQVIDAFSSLGPLMAVLGVAALALCFALVIAWFSRNSNSAALSVLIASNAEKIKELTASKEQLESERKLHSESMVILADQSVRSNDLFDAMNKRGGERDLQQQHLVESQVKIEENLKTMVTTGSAPVQEIRTRVNEIVGIVSAIDGRTADWNSILNVITPLLIELGALRTEAKKHSTQPIPPVDPPVNGTETPQ